MKMWSISQQISIRWEYGITFSFKNNINTFSPIFHSHWYMSICHTFS